MGSCTGRTYQLVCTTNVQLPNFTLDVVCFVVNSGILANIRQLFLLSFYLKFIHILFYLYAVLSPSFTNYFHMLLLNKALFIWIYIEV